MTNTDDQDGLSIDPNDPLYAFMPKSFGKQDKRKNDENDFDNTRKKLAKIHRRDQKPNQDLEEKKFDSKNENETTFNDQEESQASFMPISHQIPLGMPHTKTVSALALDPPGVRILTGSHDYSIKMYDFGGMNSSMLPFKQFPEPAGTYPIRHLTWSNTGDMFLVIPSSSQAKLFDRDGKEKAEFLRGDMYIRDMKNTNGHVAELTYGQWHPIDRQLILTSSTDSTIRIWDITNRFKQLHVVVIRSRDRGAKTKVTHAQWSRDASLLACTCKDGSIHLYSGKGPYNRPTTSLVSAISRDSDYSTFTIASDNHTFVSRTNDVVKLWDARKLTTSLAEQKSDDIYNSSLEADLVYSPDEQHILTGSSKGDLILMDRTNLEIVRKVRVHSKSNSDSVSGSNSGIVRVLWHEKINHILTSHTNGTINVLYDANVSVKGAKMSVLRPSTTTSSSGDILNYNSTGIAVDINNPIFTPDENDRVSGMWPKETQKRQKAMLRKQYKPEVPITGHGYGGRLGSSAMEHLTKNLTDTTRDEDPREALLKYDKLAKNDPMFTGIYKKTQPDSAKKWTSENDEEEN